MAKLSAAMKNLCSMEQLAEGNTTVHRLHPLIKLAVTLLYAVTVISFPRYSLSAMVPLALYPALLAALSDTPWRPLLHRLTLAAPFVLFTGAANIFLERTVLLRLGGLPVTAGELSCLSLIFKAFLTVSAVLLLAATTSLTELTNQLARCHIPRILCLQLLLTYRYLSVLLQEAERMYTAYRLRGGDARGIRFRDVGCFLGQLLLHSGDRAERIYCAMKCRGYDGSYHPGPARQITARQLLLLPGAAALILLPRFCNLSLLLGRLF